MPANCSSKSLIQIILESVIGLPYLLWLLLLDIVSIVPLFITILSYYRLSTFQALKTLDYHSTAQKSKPMPINELLRRAKGQDTKTEDEILQESRFSNERARRTKWQTVFRHLGLTIKSNLAAARKCVLLIFLDVVVLPFFIINLVIRKQMSNSQVTRVHKQKDKSRSVEEYYQAEIKLISMRLKSGSHPIKRFTTMLLSKDTLKLFGIALIAILDFWRLNSQEYTSVKEVDMLHNNSVSNSFKIFGGILTIICIIRMKFTLKRIKAYRNYKAAILKRKEAERRGLTEESGKQTLSLDSMTWDVYGRICQYLTITDLARLSQVNTKLNRLTSKDFYWEFQFNRDWIPQEIDKDTSTFKNKCIRAYMNTKKSSEKAVKHVLTVEERDRLCGLIYIMVDGVTSSLNTLPYVFLFPANILSWILLKIFRPVCGNEHYLQPKNNYFIDETRIKAISFLKGYFLKVLDPTWANFHSLHIDLERWLCVVLAKYTSEFSYFLSYIGYLLIKTTNAGGFNPMRVYYDPVIATITITPGEAFVNKIQSPSLRVVLYCTQFVLWCTYFVFITVLGFTPIGLAVYYFRQSLWDLLLLGTIVLMAFHHATMLNEIRITLQKVIECSAPHFRPWQIIRMSKKCFTNKYPRAT